MPIGNDFPTYWANLRAGVTGTRTIQSFDPSAFEVRIAAEVIGFDPATGMDAKMARRMSRFVAFAMAAGKEAVADSGIDFAAMSQDERDRVGRRRQHRWRRPRAGHRRDPRPRPEGPALRVGVRGARPVRLDGRLHALDGVRPDRAR